MYRAFIAQCKVRSVLIAESNSSRKEGPVMPLLHTLRVCQCITEGAAQCCASDLQGVGHPILSHHLNWIKRASQDGAGTY